MAIERHRRRFNFWLDTNKPDELELAKAIDELKERRQFIKNLRQAFALIMSLRSHDTSVLLSLFPWISDELAAQTAQAEHIGRLEMLAQQFENMMTTPKSEFITVIPSVRTPENTEPPRVIENEEARKELSIQNTLAALNDF